MTRLVIPAAALAAIILTACERVPSTTFQGYVEGEFVNLASPYAGQLQKLHVRRGQQVRAGQPVFALEQESERAARLESEERLKSAEARLDNLRAGRRKPELDAARAQLAQAKAARELSVAQLAQQEKLYADGYVARTRVDEARSAHQRDAARVAETEAQIRNLDLPLGRDAEREAAVAEIETARAALAQSAWRLAQRSLAAPVSGLVQDTYFVEGEWVPAGRPVAALLPPGNVKLRFFVPERAVAALAIGQPVEVSCDGCGAPLGAAISFVSAQAEYTPPVLYSRDSRAKLVFMIEARPARDASLRLRPGQPVDVSAAQK